MAFAMLITILGFLMLMDRMGLLPNAAWSYFWPVLVIAVGLSMMFNKMGHNHFWGNCCMPGGHGKHEKRSRAK